MIKLITGAKGTGKTKIIIDMANDNTRTAKGDIIFMTDTDKYSYTLRYTIRTINASCLKNKDGVLTVDSLTGYIRGILAGNHDIESFYIDGAHRLLSKPVVEMESFYDELDLIAKEHNTTFVVTISENEENFPPFLEKFKE